MSNLRKYYHDHTHADIGSLQTETFPLATALASCDAGHTKCVGGGVVPAIIGKNDTTRTTNPATNLRARTHAHITTIFVADEAVRNDGLSALSSIGTCGVGHPNCKVENPIAGGFMKVSNQTIEDQTTGKCEAPNLRKSVSHSHSVSRCTIAGYGAGLWQRPITCPLGHSFCSWDGRTTKSTYRLDSSTIDTSSEVF